MRPPRPRLHSIRGALTLFRGLRDAERRRAASDSELFEFFRAARGTMPGICPYCPHHRRAPLDLWASFVCRSISTAAGSPSTKRAVNNSNSALIHLRGIGRSPGPEREPTPPKIRTFAICKMLRKAPSFITELVLSSGRTLPFRGRRLGMAMSPLSFLPPHRHWSARDPRSLAQQSERSSS